MIKNNKERLWGYDKFPSVEIKGEIINDWKSIISVIQKVIDEDNKKLIAIDYYPGILEEELQSELIDKLQVDTVISTASLFKTEKEIYALTQQDVTDDAVFGYMTRLHIEDFFDKHLLNNCRKQLRSHTETILIYGYGAATAAENPDLEIFADMPRWELQLRYRKGLINNLGLRNRGEKASLQYKRGYFIDWRVADRYKKKRMQQWDFVLDTAAPMLPKLIFGNDYRTALKDLVKRPFRLVPFFDPGPWGGQWMKEKFDLDKSEVNYAWSFDCVPEENSLLLKSREIFFETPAINLVFFMSKELLGEAVQARFGDEFPIRFDMLDTMQGGNLSLQVHPTTEYIQEHFGMHYTQDESYYMLDAGKDACVYLGLKDTAETSEMINDLQAAQSGEINFDAEKYAAKWPVKKHDHILIPAGTVHCSGADSMVLEISATPYIFTFKLWDWNRLGLDGKPRPINIEHGKQVIDQNRREAWTKKELINHIEVLHSEDGITEEKTGLHEREFIETRRHWFSKPVLHHTNGSVNVLNLIEGDEAIVESPSDRFEPFIVHYAETFVVPAFAEEYTVRPFGKSEGKMCGTVKAYVRH